MPRVCCRTPRSGFTFYEDKFFRLMDGENIGGIRIPLAVTDRLIAEAERAEAEGQ
jgi:hypothetical protein